MKLPRLTEQNETKLQIMEFKGFNCSAKAEEGEFFDCKNLTTDYYPYLSPRKSRNVEKSFTNPKALFAKQGLCYVENGQFYFNNVAKGSVTDTKKQMVSMGDRIIIFPDKKMYDISDDALTDLEITHRQSGLVFTTNTITGSNFKFLAGDGIKISGTTKNDGTFVITSATSTVLTFASNTFLSETVSGEATLMREIPDLDYICEYNNRLWGVKGSTIYGSKIGSPYNFSAFQGLASDSYNIEVGSDGDFTGIAGLSTHLALFKENCIHKLYGSKPSNFQLSMSQVPGIQKGSSKSIVTINDTVFYKGSKGIYAYAGNTPEFLSEKFGDKEYNFAVAGTDGQKYYVSMTANEETDLYVFDTIKSLWIKEDNTEVIDFAFYDGNLYMLSTDKKLYKMSAGNELVEWSATFAETNEKVDNAKKINKLFIHADLLDDNSDLIVEINIDRKGFIEVLTASFKNRKTIKIPIAHTRCDYMQLRLSGHGNVKIHSISRAIKIGSDDI